MDQEDAKCEIVVRGALHPWREACFHVRTSAEAASYAQGIVQASIYRSFQGYRDSNGHCVPDIPSGSFEVHFATRNLSDSDIDAIVAGAVERFKSLSALQKAKVSAELCVSFTHASLAFEQNTMSRADIEQIAAAASNMNMSMKKSGGVHYSEIEEREAINHVTIVNKLKLCECESSHSLLFSQLSLQSLLSLHSALMNQLPEGGGSFRREPVFVEGSPTIRPDSSLVPKLIDQWLVSFNAGPKPGESLCDFLSRSHTEFVRVHPFMDGNGRMGRLLINIALLTRGYPMVSRTLA